MFFHHFAAWRVYFGLVLLSGLKHLELVLGPLLKAKTPRPATMESAAYNVRVRIDKEVGGFFDK